MGLGDVGSELVQAYASARPGSGTENTQDLAGETRLDERPGSPSPLHNGFCGRSRGAGCYHIYFDRNSLPDLEGFTRFEFPTIGRIYDANGQPLKEMAAESRQITRYDGNPAHRS